MTRPEPRGKLARLWRAEDLKRAHEDVAALLGRPCFRLTAKGLAALREYENGQTQSGETHGVRA